MAWQFLLPIDHFWLGDLVVGVRGVIIGTEGP